FVNRWKIVETIDIKQRKMLTSNEIRKKVNSCHKIGSELGLTKRTGIQEMEIKRVRANWNLLKSRYSEKE
ncbi:MAG: hypothetical protein ABIA63_09870, partial [bacterium]